MGSRDFPMPRRRSTPKPTFKVAFLHKMRQSLSKVRKRDREALAEDLPKVARQREKAAFDQCFKEFREVWSKTYPEVVSSWERNLYFLTSYLRYSKELQPFIYTTNALKRFCKEVKRRTKVIEYFSQPEGRG